jgi:hypothetical protein
MPFKLALFLSIAAAISKDRADLVAENVALRHQLSCLIHRGPRPKLRPVDRGFWVLLSRYWSGWKGSLALVKPATVVAWHRKVSVLKTESEPPSPPALNADQRLHRVLPGLAMMKTTNTRSSHNSRIWRRPMFNVASLRRVLKTRVDAILVVTNDIVVRESSQVARRRGARIAEFCLWMGLQGQAGDKWTCQTLKRNCPDRIKPDGTTT